MNKKDLSLRSIERTDAAYLMGLMNQEQVAQRSMLGEKVTLPRALQSVKESQDPDNALDMWMIMRGTKRLGKVNSIQLGEGDVLLGYSVSPEQKNKGVATEAVRQLIALLTSPMDSRLRGNDEKMGSNKSIRRLQALVEPDNIASIRVLEKNDFGLVGLIERSASLGSGANRDLLLYEIDYNEKRED